MHNVLIIIIIFILILLLGIIYKNPFEKFQTSVAPTSVIPTTTSINYFTTTNDLTEVKNSLLTKINDKTNVIKKGFNYKDSVETDGLYFDMSDLYLNQINDLQFKLYFKKPVQDDIMFITNGQIKRGYIDGILQGANDNEKNIYKFLSYQMNNKIGQYINMITKRNKLDEKIAPNASVYNIKTSNNKYYFNRQYNVSFAESIYRFSTYYPKYYINTYTSNQIDITPELDSIKQLLLNKVYGGKFNISRYNFSLTIADDIIFTVVDNELSNINTTELLNNINEINDNNIFNFNNLKGSIFKIQNMSIKLKLISSNIIVYSLTFTEPLKLYNITRTKTTNPFILGGEIKNTYNNVLFKFIQDNNNIFFNRIATVPDALGPKKNKTFNMKYNITNQLNALMNSLNITTVNPSTILNKIIRTNDKEIIFYISNI